MHRSLPRVEAIILDMDGTLVDTESLYKQVWQISAKQLGFHISDYTYTRLIGIPFMRSLDAMEPLLPAHISRAQFHQQLAETQKRLQTHGFPMKPGAEELLALLKEDTLPVALVTSSDRNSVNKNFAHTPYARMFSAMVTFEDTAMHKPDPAPYLYACTQLGLAPTTVLAIEDSNPGARSALRAGCHTLVVPDVLPPEQAIREKAAGIYDDLYQVIEQVITPLLLRQKSSRV